MNILGIHASFTGTTHDSSACIIKNGKLICAIEEEKLIRIKSASTYFPYNAIKECLKISNLKISDIDVVASAGITYPNLKAKIKKSLEHFFHYSPKIEIYHHAYSHCYGAFYLSGFKNSLNFSFDGSGDKVSTLVLHGDTKGSKKIMKNIFEADSKKSLGNLYTAFTNFLGFKSIEGEYKLMGMAAYGKAKYNLQKLIYFDEKKEKIITSRDYFKIIDTKNYTTINEPCYSEMFIKKKYNITKPVNTNYFKQEHYDLAASIQDQFTKVYVQIIKFFIEKTKTKKITLSGGCALNCLANKELLRENVHVYVMPAASDRGLSLGAATMCLNKYSIKFKKKDTLFLGKKYSNREVIKDLKDYNIKYKSLKNHHLDCATEISKGKVIGWFQGRSEFGPRALGARSILASPKIYNMKFKLNKKIKFRENYRPFAPSILKKTFLKYHKKVPADMTSMTIAININKKLKKLIPETVHFDNTARIHLVDHKNKNLFKLLNCLQRKNKTGAVINTSFNLNMEPNVDSPKDAIRTFYSSGLDVLYLNNLKIEKV